MRLDGDAVVRPAPLNRRSEKFDHVVEGRPGHAELRLPFVVVELRCRGPEVLPGSSVPDPDQPAGGGYKAEDGGHGGQHGSAPPQVVTPLLLGHLPRPPPPQELRLEPVQRDMRDAAGNPRAPEPPRPPAQP